MLLLVGGRVDLENYLISRERPHTVFDVKIMFQMVSCKPVSFSKVDYFGKKTCPQETFTMMGCVTFLFIDVVEVTFIARPLEHNPWRIFPILAEPWQY